jgi:dTDP-4-dehydrorhamnose reductase
MKKILILGASGMLGSQLLKYFNKSQFQIYSTKRDSVTNPNQFRFDAAIDNVSRITNKIIGVDYVINCIGVIKPHILNSNPESIEKSIRVNSLFPHILNSDAMDKNYRIIQIATDCVFSGKHGSYNEISPHDPQDVYGKTKSLGEVRSNNFMNVRSSIIGPEEGRSTSLWEWVVNQPLNATIDGYTDHFWNGVTTKVFAELCFGLINRDIFRAGTFHFLPENTVSKFELVKQIAGRNNRLDIKITPKTTGDAINRTLGTLDPAFNVAMWNSAGYSTPPKIEEMVKAAQLSSNL